MCKQLIIILTWTVGRIEPDDVVPGLVVAVLFVQGLQDVPGWRRHQGELVARLGKVALDAGVAVDVRRVAKVVVVFDVGVLVDVDAQVEEGVLTVGERP